MPLHFFNLRKYPIILQEADQLANWLKLVEDFQDYPASVIFISFVFSHTVCCYCCCLGSITLKFPRITFVSFHFLISYFSAWCMHYRGSGYSWIMHAWMNEKYWKAGTDSNILLHLCQFCGLTGLVCDIHSFSFSWKKM